MAKKPGDPMSRVTRSETWTAWTISAKIDGMKHLSWSRSDIRSDLKKVPMIWKVTLGIILAITTMFVKYLTELFHVTHDSWTYVVIAAIYVLAIFVALRFLRLKLSNSHTT
jgi:hypothetical protein